jgi:predicted O-methyltransferase YrrM
MTQIPAINYRRKLADLPMRVWRRFTRIPGIDKIVIVLNDKIINLNFHLDNNQKSIMLQGFENCRSLEDYFAFSKEVFGPHQIKSEVLGFLEFARFEKPEIVCEIGTADGGTNFLLSQSLPTVQFMIGVDLYVKNKSKLQYFSRKDQKIKLIDGSSYSVNALSKVKSALVSRKIDILFIDGDHTYDGVKQDFLNYRHFVREGGIIVFHDIAPDYLTRYGTQTGRWAGDVPRFWNQVKSKYPFYEFVEDPEQDGLGIGAIRYSPDVSLAEDFS